MGYSRTGMRILFVQHSIELEMTAATWCFTIVLREGPEGSFPDVLGMAKAVQPK